MSSEIFRNIDIVLSSPQSPENIGLTARVMKNTGFKSLKLVNPNLNNKSFEVSKRARDVLKKAEQVSSLKEAVSSSEFVFGTTRRKREYKYIYNLNYLQNLILSLAKEKKISLVFGREDTGLSREELDLCDSVFYIPAYKKFPSYNLGFSVGIVCYEIFNISEQLSEVSSLNLAKKKEVQTFFNYLSDYLYDKLENKKAGSALKTLKRVLGRTHLTKNEVSLFKSLLLKELAE